MACTDAVHSGPVVYFARRMPRRHALRPGGISWRWVGCSARPVLASLRSPIYKNTTTRTWLILCTCADTKCAGLRHGITPRLDRASFAVVDNRSHGVCPLPTQSHVFAHSYKVRCDAGPRSRVWGEESNLVHCAIDHRCATCSASTTADSLIAGFFSLPQRC